MQLPAALLTTSRIVSTARVARHMEWRKDTAAALCVWMGGRRSSAPSVAIGFHPSQNKTPQQILHFNTPSARRTRRQTQQTVQSLQATLRQFPHLPLVIGWPVQRDSGACGAACGRVLHMLDRLQHATTDSATTVSFYTPTTASSHASVDALGRDPTYSRTSPKHCHVASQEQYHQHALVDVQNAADLWKTVCADVWEDDEAANESSSWTTTTATAALFSSVQQQQQQQPTLVQQQQQQRE